MCHSNRAAVEVLLDGVAFLFLAPGSVYLLGRWPHPHAAGKASDSARCHVAAANLTPTKHASIEPTRYAVLYESPSTNRTKDMKSPSAHTQGRGWSTGYVFIVLNVVFSIVYPLYNIVIDAPMYVTALRSAVRAVQ
eukprot:m.974302 g.974302  ORF g.974302 m.974302 type:complete len:136 (-) comp23938_c0_seq18:4587-4994(-)